MKNSIIFNNGRKVIRSRSAFHLYGNFGKGVKIIFLNSELMSSRRICDILFWQETPLYNMISILNVIHASFSPAQLVLASRIKNYLFAISFN